MLIPGHAGLQLTILVCALFATSSCMALDCRDSASNAFNVRHAINTAIRGARNTVDYAIIWTSAAQTIKLKCTNNIDGSSDEGIYLHLDPSGKNARLEGIEFGILYGDSEYWGNSRVDTGQRVRASEGARDFSVTFQILLRKRPFRSALPVSSVDELDLFHVNGAVALGISGGYSYTLTGLQKIRLVECLPVLPGHSATGKGTAPRGVTTGGGALYQAGFEARYWSGSLTRQPLASDTAGNLSIHSSATWDAADQISNDPDGRRIYTAVRGDKPAAQTQAFTWQALTLKQRNLFLTHPVGGREDFLGRERIAYLRGARARESGTNKFRERKNLLGDIVNSSVLYVGPPSALLPARLRSRRPAIYVGANDGMLHAFDADSGGELFSYVPQMLINKLRALTATAYSHRPYVDGALATAEVPIAATDSWRSVLVAGLGGGAPGAVALDISNPENFSDGGVLWEFSQTDDADMGYLTSAPVIARFNLGTASSPQLRHFAILASGPRNVHPDAASGPGILFLLALDAPVTTWLEGINYFKLKTVSTPRGYGDALAAPGVVLDANGTVDTLYSGDLQGNMWRFKFSAVSSPADLSKVIPMRLFLARDASGRSQPISTRPQVLHAPHGGFLVLFGTGQLIDHADLDPSTFTPQSFYAVRDLSGDFNRVRANLEARTLTAVSDDGFLIAGSALAYENDSKLGWYLDFPDVESSGERVIYDPVVTHGQLIFNTLSAAASACQPVIGRSYRLDALAGINSNTTGISHKHGLLGTPIVYTSSSATATQIHILAAATNATGAPAAQILHRFGVSRTRKSWGWKEIPDWRKLHPLTSGAAR